MLVLEVEPVIVEELEIMYEGVFKGNETMVLI
jgi:hypothetical protein